MEANLAQLQTPCLLLEEQIMKRNIQLMRSKAQANQVRLRPHAKTAKSAAILSQFEGMDTPITVSTLKEAEYFAEQGFNDVLYAVCVSPDKFSRIAQIRQRGVALTILLDSVEVAHALIAWSELHNSRFSVAIEIDCDGHRAGLVPDSAILIALVNVLHGAQNIDFWGLVTHGGGAYDCDSWQHVKQHANRERAALLTAKMQLNRAGYECTNLSLGSTPTVVAAEHFDGIDEIRPGVFVFFDLFQAQLGACRQEDIALSVLATVTSHKAETNRVFLDAGGLALSKDRSTKDQKQDYGYGKLIKLDGSEFSALVCVSDVNQEHGVVQLPEGVSITEFPIGSRVRILPNHACMTAAAYSGYNLVSDHSIHWLPRCNGW